MGFARQLTTVASRTHLPRRTVRLRLTALFGSLFLLSGIALLAITYVLVTRATASNPAVVTLPDGATVGVSRIDRSPAADQQAGLDENARLELSLNGGPAPEQGYLSPQQVFALAARQHAETMRQLLVQSGIALAVMAVVSMGLGWVIAGRALRPLRTITATARDISATNLHQRLALSGPADELKELGDTIDGLLDRLEAAFQAQRQFVANASHELRTPLTRQRTLIQVALTDPDATADSLRMTLERALASTGQEEQLIEALLTLTRGQSGLDRREAFDLVGVTEEVLLARERDAKSRGLQVHSALSPAYVSGDRRLVERLLANLVDNALRYNFSGGLVEVVTESATGRSVVSVTNTGPDVPESEVERLPRPFLRFGAERTNTGGGLGLGLSIVQAIASAHAATLAIHPRDGGGLRVEVSFPAIGQSERTASSNGRPGSQSSRAAVASVRQ
ncbi:MAG: HAMP domain-containing protein [Chloroflexi bacterium]|nr:HAMP domain-containing protein [Chloroflexota bacterium]